MNRFESIVKANESIRMPLEENEEEKMNSTSPRVVIRRKSNVPSDELLKLLRADVDNRGDSKFENFSSIKNLREYYETLPLNRGNHNIKNYFGGTRIPDSGKNVNVHGNTDQPVELSKLAEEKHLRERGQGVENYSFDLLLETPCDVDSVLTPITTLDDSYMDDITIATLPPISPNRRNFCRRKDKLDYEGLSLLAKKFPDASIKELQEMHLNKIRVGYDEYDRTSSEGENCEIVDIRNDPLFESSILNKSPKVNRVLKISIIVLCIFASAMHIALAIYKSREQWMPVFGVKKNTQNFNGEHEFFEDYIREESAQKEAIETERHASQRDQEQVQYVESVSDVGAVSEEASKSVTGYVEREPPQKEAIETKRHAAEKNGHQDLAVGDVSVEISKSVEMVHSKKEFDQVVHAGKGTEVKQVGIKLAPQVKALMVTKNEAEKTPKKAEVTEHKMIKISEKDMTAEELRLLELAVRRTEEELMQIKAKLEIFEQNNEIKLAEIEPNAKIEIEEKKSVNYQAEDYDLTEAIAEKSSNTVKPTSRILMRLFDMYANDSILSDHRLGSKDEKKSVVFNQKPVVLQRLYEMYDNDSVLSHHKLGSKDEKENWLSNQSPVILQRLYEMYDNDSVLSHHKLCSNDEEIRLSNQSPAILQRLYEMYADEPVIVQKSDRLSTNLDNASDDFISEIFQRLFNMYANERISKS